MSIWFPEKTNCGGHLRNCPDFSCISRWGHQKDSLSLNERTFGCENCGFKTDRDLNAAINLALMAVSSTVSACGLDSADTTSLKQEVNVKSA